MAEYIECGKDNPAIDDRYMIHYAAGSRISQCWSCEYCEGKKVIVRPIKDVDGLTRHIPLYFPVCRGTGLVMMWVYEARCPKFTDSGGVIDD